MPRPYRLCIPLRSDWDVASPEGNREAVKDRALRVGHARNTTLTPVKPAHRSYSGSRVALRMQVLPPARANAALSDAHLA